MDRMGNRLAAVLLAATVPMATPALAQRNGNYPVQEMNFDLWCQEQAGLPTEGTNLSPVASASPSP